MTVLVDWVSICWLGTVKADVSVTIFWKSLTNYVRVRNQLSATNEKIIKRAIFFYVMKNFNQLCYNIHIIRRKCSVSCVKVGSVHRR